MTRHPRRNATGPGLVCVLRVLRSTSLWVMLLVLSAGARPLRAADIPYLTGRVVDDANILSAQARARLAATLKAHEEATTDQIVVLTVPTIQPQSIEDYAVKVFEAWKLGEKGRDNGVLVVIVPQDRKMRIEVGYGLEPTLTDGTCGEIIRNVMTPQFKNGNYDAGVEQGVAAIVGKIERHADVPSAPSSAAGSSSSAFETIPFPMNILYGAFTFGIIGLFTFVGVMTPGVGWFLYFFLIPFWAMFPLAILGPHGTFALLMTYLVAYPVGKILLGRSDWYKKAAKDLKTTGHASIGGFTFASAGGGGSFSSDSGFSGGGGSSGGGGASGSW